MLFYDRLSDLCKKSGTSITAFALEAGCHRSTPTGWKNGSVPGADTVIKAAERFAVTTDYLLGLSDKPERPKEELSLPEYELLHAFRAADPVLRSAALAVLTSAEPNLRGGTAKFSTSRETDLRDVL